MEAAGSSKREDFIRENVLNLKGSQEISSTHQQEADNALLNSVSTTYCSWTYLNLEVARVWVHRSAQTVAWFKPDLLLFEICTRCLFWKMPRPHADKLHDDERVPMLQKLFHQDRILIQRCDRQSWRISRNVLPQQIKKAMVERKSSHFRNGQPPCNPRVGHKTWIRLVNCKV